MTMTKLIFVIVSMLLAGCNGGYAEQPTTVFTPHGVNYIIHNSNGTYTVI